MLIEVTVTYDEETGATGIILTPAVMMNPPAVFAALLNAAVTLAEQRGLNTDQILVLITDAIKGAEADYAKLLATPRHIDG